MHAAYKRLKWVALSGDLKSDVVRFLQANGCDETAQHCVQVGEEARKIATAFRMEPIAAAYAGYLHDISAVFPNTSRIEVARKLNIELLEEELALPMIIHQKISKAMAKDIFGITDPHILDAVGCHTTLRRGSTKLDRLLFVADKIKWDQPGEPPYLDEIVDKLRISIDHAAFVYLEYMWRQKDKLKVIHPWLRDAYLDVQAQLGKSK